MFLIQLVLFGIISATASGDVLPSAQPPIDVAEETQHAVCRVITQEIQTTANATIKRQLKGVCTSRQLEHRFAALEKKLLVELTEIKSLLGRDLRVKTQSTDYEYYEDQNLGEGIVALTETLVHESSSTRSEINKLNNTVYILNNQKVYSYYWQIPQVRATLRKHGVQIRSPDLYVLGHAMCIQLYPNYLESSYLGLQLRPDGNFSKKHKFAVLDQLDANKDIKSQSLGGTGSYDGMYQVPYAKLEERNYLRNDLVIVKLTIYLDS